MSRVLDVSVSIPLRSDFNWYIRNNGFDGDDVSIPLRSDFNVLYMLCALYIIGFNPSKV